MNQAGNSGYEPFDWLIAGLKVEGYPTQAQRLHAILHETAWTTSSELLGKLGREIVVIQRTSPAFSAELRKGLDDCLAVVRRAWPTIGQ